MTGSGMRTPAGENEDTVVPMCPETCGWRRSSRDHRCPRTKWTCAVGESMACAPMSSARTRGGGYSAAVGADNASCDRAFGRGVAPRSMPPAHVGEARPAKRSNPPSLPRAYSTTIRPPPVRGRPLGRRRTRRTVLHVAIHGDPGPRVRILVGELGLHREGPLPLGIDDVHQDAAGSCTLDEPQHDVGRAGGNRRVGRELPARVTRTASANWPGQFIEPKSSVRATRGQALQERSTKGLASIGISRRAGWMRTGAPGAGRPSGYRTRPTMLRLASSAPWRRTRPRSVEARDLRVAWGETSRTCGDGHAARADRADARLAVRVGGHLLWRRERISISE
jgi:hypothetical protein